MDGSVDTRVTELINDLDYLANVGRIKPVKSDDDKGCLLDISLKFTEYHKYKSPERHLEEERSKLDSKLHQYFLVTNMQGEAVGYYSIEYPCATHNGVMKLDQIFVDESARGGDVAYLMLMHLMQKASIEFSQLKTDAVVVYHFREQEDDPTNIENLGKIKGLLKKFGFKFMPSNGTRCPMSVRRLDKGVYDFMHLPIPQYQHTD